MNSKTYLVLDTASNRERYPTCIGRTFEIPPTDAEIEEVVEPETEGKETE